MNLTRLGIFSFYDREGSVDEYVEYLLRDLKNCLSRLIIVINGEVSQQGKRKLEKYSKEVLLRENKGFDAGAYKEVFVKYLPEKEISRYDEIVLCNDTFYGPIIPFQDIFQKMDAVRCDFWGMNYRSFGVLDYLESYFLVFRGRALQKDLISYFRNNIEENAHDIEDVCAFFERGLFMYLTREKNRFWGTYADRNDYNIFRSSASCIKKAGLPLIKRKAFSSRYYVQDQVLGALRYIKANSSYPVNDILNSVRRLYGLDITMGMAESSNTEDERMEEYRLPMSIQTPETIREFAEDSEELYIYGAGIWGRAIYWCYARGRAEFKGFVVSEGEKTSDCCMGHPVIPYSRLEGKPGDIIVGLDSVNTQKVRGILEGRDRVLYLWS